jgi:hypothetical protein
MAVPRAYLEEHIHLLKTHVTGKLVEFVFNLDELGSADWEDWKANKVIADTGVAKEDVYYPVPRHYPQVRRLARVSAAGYDLTPLLITGSRSLTLFGAAV